MALLAVAVDIANRPGGWSKLTRRAIAREAACSEGLVSLYLGDVPTIRKAVIRAAVRRELVEIIVQSIAANDGYTVTRWLPKSLRTKAVNSLLDK